MKARLCELVSNTQLLTDRFVREFKATVPERTVSKAGGKPYLNIYFTTQAAGDGEYDSPALDVASQQIK